MNPKIRRPSKKLHSLYKSVYNLVAPTVTLIELDICITSEFLKSLVNLLSNMIADR